MILYRNSYTKQDPERIANIVKSLNSNWVVTYYACDFIRGLCDDFHMEIIQ